jgi:hypothetical protein
MKTITGHAFEGKKETKNQTETASLFPRLEYFCSAQWVPPRQWKTSPKRDI